MTIKWTFYLLLLLSATCIGSWRWARLATADRILASLMGLTFVSETIAFLTAWYLGNNLNVYHIFNPVQFLLTSLYFNYSLASFRKRNIGWIIGFAGVTLSILNSVFLQKPGSINTNALMLNGGVIIVYALLALYEILMEEERMPWPFAMFWISLASLLYWSSTFTGWGLYAILQPTETETVRAFHAVLTGGNFLYYTGIAAVFGFYPKLIPSAPRA